MTPSPQCGGLMDWHVDEQELDPVGPASHCSLHSVTPLPQRSNLHVAESPSASQGVAEPRSPSSPHSTIPSPQKSSIREQSCRQPSQSTVLPSSQTSHSGFSTPSPHLPVSFLQVREQPSQDTVLPSSHSSPASSTPLPHPGAVQPGTDATGCSTAAGTMVAPVRM